MNQLERMRELIDKIEKADRAYYQKDDPIISDREYDELVIELTMLEKISGIHFNDSPIGKIPTDAKEELKTYRHSQPMLSAKKTKDIHEFGLFLRKKDSVISWKLDGLTLVLRYKQGNLVQALTRGKDGLEGEDVTHTVKEIRNIPTRVMCKEDFEVRGEGVISWDDHAILSKFTGKTTHPRNMVSGLVRSYLADIGKLNHVDFIAFELIKETNAPKTKVEQLKFLKDKGFDVVEHFLLKDTPIKEITDFVENWQPSLVNYPVDGLIGEYNDIDYGKSLGATAHHEKRMLAYKWNDELKETVFRGVQLNTTRTGKVSICALFDPVKIDNTKFQRASLHTLENFRKLKLGVGDIITVYKANKIVPQVAENKMMSGTYELPKFCPSCGERLVVKTFETNTEYLYCPNESCVARSANKISSYCSAMGIHGISSTKAEDMVAYGWIGHYKDIYHLGLHRNEICDNPKFGLNWYDQVQGEIEKSKDTLMKHFLHGLGIPRLGKTAAEQLHTYFYGDITEFLKGVEEGFSFSRIDGIDQSVETEIYKWFENTYNVNMIKELLTELNFMGVSRINNPEGNPFEGKKVAISGTYKNFTHALMKDLLQSMGATVYTEGLQDAEFLVYGTMPNSQMVGAAIERSVTLVSEEGFAKMLGMNQWKEWLNTF